MACVCEPHTNAKNPAALDDLPSESHLHPAPPLSTSPSFPSSHSSQPVMVLPSSSSQIGSSECLQALRAGPSMSVNPLCALSLRKMVLANSNGCSTPELSAPATHMKSCQPHNDSHHSSLPNQPPHAAPSITIFGLSAVFFPVASIEGLGSRPICTILRLGKTSIIRTRPVLPTRLGDLMQGLWPITKPWTLALLEKRADDKPKGRPEKGNPAKDDDEESDNAILELELVMLQKRPRPPRSLAKMELSLKDLAPNQALQHRIDFGFGLLTLTLKVNLPAPNVTPCPIIQLSPDATQPAALIPPRCLAGGCCASTQNSAPAPASSCGTRFSLSSSPCSTTSVLSFSAPAGVGPTPSTTTTSVVSVETFSRIFTQSFATSLSSDMIGLSRPSIVSTRSRNASGSSASAGQASSLMRAATRSLSFTSNQPPKATKESTDVDLGESYTQDMVASFKTSKSDGLVCPIEAW